MKYSEDTDAHREANKSYANERWRQLYGLQNEWGSEGIKYLLLVNSGAAVAMLAFLGSVPEARKLWWPVTILGIFSSGIVLIGFLHALRHYHVSKLFKEWRESVNNYYTDQKGWGEIIEGDANRSGKFDWALVMAYVSFACFIFGVTIGAVNFSTLAIGESHGRQETSTTINTAKTISTSSESSAGQGRQIADKGRNAKQPASGTGSEKEIKPDVGK